MGVKVDKNEKLSLMRTFLQSDTAPIFLVFIVFIIVVGFIQPRFLMPMNIRNILIQVSITGMLALGMTLVMLSGGIDLSVGWFVSFVGCAMAYLMVAGLSIPVVVILGIFISVLCSGVMGFIISRTKLEPFIVSLGFMIIFQGFTYLITKGSEISIGDTFKLLGRTFPLGIGMPVYVFISLAIFLGLMLKYTKFGRRIYAVGCNENAAYLAGINVKSFKLIIYIINGLLISIAAMTQLSRLGTGNPLMGSGKEIDAIAAAVVGGTALSGGKGNILGTVIGILLLGSITNAMNVIGISPHWQYVFKGAVIVVSVTVSYYSSLKSSTL
ncbi:MAG: ABC transporter permease [Candidatus Atribacteria bacterium]|nr:ABC transporter permease [Candidatus Atribacteria bacterium]